MRAQQVSNAIKSILPVAFGLCLGSALSITLFTAVGCGHTEKRKPQSETVAQIAPFTPDGEDEKILHSYEEQNKKAFFQWPVDQARLTRGFLPNKRRPHWGIDLAAHKGTPILAAHDGVVIYAGKEFRGYGRMVMLEGAKGWASIYGHFAKIVAKEGQMVKQGDLIGYMGRTGRATGVHLHFEIRKGKGPVDPLLYLPGGAEVSSKITGKYQDIMADDG